MHSHHSHSGDYVSHAKDHLDDIVALAAEMGFGVFCLTEHQPRLHNKYLYPEEHEKAYTTQLLSADFSRYMDHAYRLQQRYNSNTDMKILIGFEVEGMDDEHIDSALAISASDPRLNMSVGSVHYVNQIPIDFDRELWLQARDSVPGKTTRALYAAYFELQYKVITRVQPTVIGHFDLIRLFETGTEIDPTTGKPINQIVLEQDWPEVWELVVRNIKYAAEYGALFELNSAAIRKGWDSPYPRLDMSNAIKKYGGARFCLSDDSHGLNQVGLNYDKMWLYIKDVLRLTHIFHLDLSQDGKTCVKTKIVDELDSSSFWKQYNP